MDIQLPLWVGILVLINIPAGVQGYLPCLCPTALLHGRYCFPGAWPETFQPQEQIQDSSGHKGTSSVVSPPSAFLNPTSVRPVGAEAEARPDGANRRSTVCEEELRNMSPCDAIPPCWVHTLKCNGSSWFKVSPSFICGILSGWVRASGFWFSLNRGLIFAEWAEFEPRDKKNLE